MTFTERPGTDLTEIEMASGVVLGVAPAVPALRTEPRTTPRLAFEAVVRRSLRRPPCGITFSGGRDSSAALAVAVDIARREGLDLPVPITIRWRGVEEADERPWQRQVVEHLRLREWIVDDVGDELDFCGPVAARVVASLGAYYPAHYHAVAHMARHVRGGSLVTGYGGDSLLASWRWRHLHHRDGTNPAVHALRIAHGLAPVPVRRAIAARRGPPPAAWLARPIADDLAARAADERATEPRRWADRLDWLARRQSLVRANTTLRRMGALHDVAVADPFSDRAFLAAMAHEHPVRGPGLRDQVMHDVFGDVLPAAVIERSDKAVMTRGYLRGPTRVFAERWDGTGFDPSVLVDPEPLRRLWLATDGRAALTLLVAFARDQRLIAGPAA